MTSRTFYFVLFMLLLSSGFVSGQTCEVDTNNFNLISPASDQLPCIEKGKDYEAVLQFFTPPALGGVGIDSIVVTTFQGLPSGITPLCTPITCTMQGLGRACITLTGNTSDTAGIYPILYNGYAYTDLGVASFNYLRANLPGALPEYELYVIDSNQACRGEVNFIAKTSASPAVFTVFPNPSTGSFVVSVNGTRQTGFSTLRILDMAGRTIFEQENVGQQDLHFSSYANGLYFIQLKTSEGIFSKKISIQR